MAIASFRAGQTISTGDVVYVGASGLLYEASAAYRDQASVVGLAIEGGSAGSLIRVNTDAVYSNASGLVPGEIRYVSLLTSGQHVNYSGFINELTLTTLDGAYLEVVGRAVTTSGIEVEAGKPFFLNNTASYLLMLESSTGLVTDAMLLEDGSFINLETA